jgi:hypothetical protein
MPQGGVKLGRVWKCVVTIINDDSKPKFVCAKLFFKYFTRSVTYAITFFVFFELKKKSIHFFREYY